MKHFEASGLWYTDDPANAVSGTLRFDGQGLLLTLLGGFRKGWSPGGQRYPIIRGVVGESPYGAFVTLIECFTTESKFNMVGATSEKILCHKAVVGDLHLSEGPARFESLELDYTHLTEWVGQGGLNVEEKLGIDKTYLANYRKPENVRLPFGDQTLTLGFKFNASQETHRVTMTEAARLIIEPVGEVTPATIGQEYVRTLQNLLTFATDTPNAEEEIVYSNNTNDQGLTPRLSLLYSRIFKSKLITKPLDPWDILFTYAVTQAAGLNVFQRWLEFSAKHKEFCSVYFTHLYARPKYLEDKFAKALSAFALLASSHAEPSEGSKQYLADVESAMTTRFPVDERELLGHLIPTGPEVEMPLRLLRLMRENAHLMGQVIEDFPTFVRSISDTLGSIQRRAEGARSPLKGSDLLHAMDKIHLLTKVIMLKELGFAEETVRTLIERNEQFNFLKTV